MKEPEKKSWHDSVPFPRHWLAYTILKIALLAAAIYIAARLMGWI